MTQEPGVKRCEIANNKKVRYLGLSPQTEAPENDKVASSTPKLVAMKRKEFVGGKREKDERLEGGKVGVETLWRRKKAATSNLCTGLDPVEALGRPGDVGVERGKAIGW